MRPTMVIMACCGLLIAGLSAQAHEDAAPEQKLAARQLPEPKGAAPEEKAVMPAQAGFERLKALAAEGGVWEGANTEGVRTRMRFSVIAAGSCVMESCEFDAHPEQTMITMYHLDGDHLMLTHYCVAKNQPRMRATEISADAKTILFTFHDGTNLRSRDAGHMDKAWFDFIDPDHLASKWTWYENGKETWMEQFTYERKK